MASKLEVGAACAIIGAAAFSIHGVYVEHAGSLNDCRTAPAGDSIIAEKLHDADFLTGALVALIGGSLGIVTKRSEPALIALSAFGIISGYYHLACNQSSIQEGY